MTLHQYENAVDKAEKEFEVAFESEMDYVDSIIDEAYGVLEKAMTLYLKSDVLSSAMTMEEFKQYLLGELKDVL